MMSTIINFTCPHTECGWQEEIGIDVKSGMLIKGDITLICPVCGGMIHVGNQILLVPAKIKDVKRWTRPPKPSGA